MPSARVRRHRVITGMLHRSAAGLMGVPVLTSARAAIRSLCVHREAPDFGAEIAPLKVSQASSTVVLLAPPALLLVPQHTTPADGLTHLDVGLTPPVSALLMESSSGSTVLNTEIEPLPPSPVVVVMGAALTLVWLMTVVMGGTSEDAWTLDLEAKTLCSAAFHFEV